MTAVKSNADILAEDLKRLDSSDGAINLYPNEHPLTQEETPEVKEEEPVTEVQEENPAPEQNPEVQPEVKPEIKAEEKKPEIKIAEVKKELIPDMFADASRNTEHDHKQKSRIEQMGDTFLSEIDLKETAEEDDPDVKKANAQASAAGWVTCIDLVFMFICMWAANDWENNMEKPKYSLHPNRQKAIQLNIYRILMLRKKKSNPYGALFGVIITSYIPMIIFAWWKGRKSKTVAAQTATDADFYKKLYEAEKQKNTQAKYNGAEAKKEMVVVKKEEVKVVAAKPAATSAKGKQGRHKKGCSYYTDNSTCNCK